VRPDPAWLRENEDRAVRRVTRGYGAK
jgi:hypothetical protein